MMTTVVVDADLRLGTQTEHVSITAVEGCQPLSIALSVGLALSRIGNLSIVLFEVGQIS
jgi:hypothetical protein